MKSVKFNKKLKTLLILFFIGFIIGIVLSKNKSFVLPINDLNEMSKIKIFINTFSINIWLMLLIWLVDNIFVGVLITFLKGLTEGVTFIWVIIIMKDLKISNLISYLLYWSLLIPLFIWIVYKIKITKKNGKDYKEVIVCFIIVSIYSLLISIIN